MKKLTNHEIVIRKDNVNYFKNGKPKKSSMLCRNRRYLKEIENINGAYDISWVCGGNSCQLYAIGCDNRGNDWN